MTCASCGHEYREGAAFCHYCGTPIAVDRGQQTAMHRGDGESLCVCGRSLAASEAFCPSCGRPRTSSAPPPPGAGFSSGFGPAGGFGTPSGFGSPGGSGAGPGYPQNAYQQGAYPQGAYPQGAYPQGGYPGQAQPGYPNSYLPVPIPPRALAPYRQRDKVVAGLLGIFLGSIGIHKFYLGQPGWGIIYLLFCWTGIPFLVGLIEGIVYLVQSEQEFDYQYNYRR
jgi:TM2 domain-containing membrane protein YozV